MSTPEAGVAQGSQFIKAGEEDNGAIRILTIDRPPVNAMSRQALEELRVALKAFAGAANAKVLVITGAGQRAFIAGADIGEIAGITGAKQGETLAREGQGVLDLIEGLDKPVFAAINGVCLGGGNELALACHIRIASDRAKFGQPEVNLGIIPGFGGTQRLARLVGESRARELALTGDLITAQEAFRIGLVNRIVPDAEVMKQTVGLARKVAQKSQVAVRLIQQAIREGTPKPLSEGLSLEASLFGKICETEDMREGLKAFVERRQPNFKDR